MKTKRAARTLKLVFNNSGFTIIEILVTLVIIAGLVAALYAVLSQRQSNSHNENRRGGGEEILAAIKSSVAESGTFPTNFPEAGIIKQLGTGNAEVCSSTIGSNVATQCTGVTPGCADLMADVAQDLIPYLASLPIDPIGGTTADATKTGYTVVRDTKGIVTVKACHADGTSPITVSR